MTTTNDARTATSTDPLPTGQHSAAETSGPDLAAPPLEAAQRDPIARRPLPQVVAFVPSRVSEGASVTTEGSSRRRERDSGPPGHEPQDVGTGERKPVAPTAAPRQQQRFRAPQHQCGQTDELAVAELVVNPHDLVVPGRTPDTITGWKALAEGLLSVQCCAFHRNMEISSRYAWIHQLKPTWFKWAAMAAIASHHVRLALFPLRLDTDGTGYLNISRSLGRRRVLLTADVNTIRATNNAIFDDIFWAHLAYVTADNGIERLRDLLSAEDDYAPLLAGFETIDHGRRIREDATASAAARRIADDLIWAGNLQLLEHEQRAVVQPNFDLLSCTYARLISLGSASSFEVRGLQQELVYFTSFYLYSMTRGIPDAVRAQAWPRITRFEDRWRWLETSVVPRFRRFADTRLIDGTLQRIIDDARAFAATPCIHPDHAPTRPRRTPPGGAPRHPCQPVPGRDHE